MQFIIFYHAKPAFYKSYGRGRFISKASR